MLSIPQSNPKANYLAHKEEIDAAIERVLDSGWYILGREVAAFEQEFADYIDVSHGVGVASGTDAIHLALRSCDIGPGDLVFTVSHTAVATVAAIELCGATPVFVDVDPGSFAIDPNCLEEGIKSAATGSTPRAIVPVHMYGHPVDMVAIAEIARRYELHIIEDCAQSHGATCQGRKAGAWGNLATFSFYPTKNLASLGDGGMVVTNDPALAEKVRLLREYGWHAGRRYVSEFPGTNSRLDELQAAVLREKLHHLDTENDRRRKLACTYHDLLQETNLILPQAYLDARPVYHQYVIRTSRRDVLRNYLRANGVETLIHYPVPVHLQPAYARRRSQYEQLSQTEAIVTEILSLPMYPELHEDQAQTIAQYIRNWETLAG